jgi:CubicO group peptidase (beta-lactamase class C family)
MTRLGFLPNDGVALALCASACLLGATSGAQEASLAPSPSATPQLDVGHRLTAEDAQAWLDGFMSYSLDRSAIPGAVVVVVKDGQVLLEKGYGVSDVTAGTKVDPRRTLFRLGSVSKLFTWTAVMQLVENGKLTLDADINQYLDFKIPQVHGQSITLRNLMTHTAGFEEAVSGIAAQDAKDIPSLGAALKHWTPRRIFDPGTTPAYSNYGASLAGYIVERVSGERFADYMARHIFTPLGMQHSTFDQPLPAPLLSNMSKGYLNGETTPGLYELVVWQPAGSVSTTGDDMSRFMIAHLQHGRFEESQILRPLTADQMHTTALALVPPLDGMDLGFYEENINGHRVIGHEGDTVFFHTALSLYLDDGIGVFVALNALGKDDAVYGVRTKLFQAFSDRYLPGRETDGSVDLPSARAHADMFANSYAASRAWQSSFMSALNVFFPTTIVSNSDGTISVSTSKTLSGGLRRYREISPFVWRDIAGHDRLAAIVKDDRIIRFSSDEYSPFLVMDAVPWWRAAPLLRPIAIVGLFVIFLTVASWPISALARRRYGAMLSAEGAPARARRLVHLAAALALAAVAGWLWIVSVILSPTGIYFLGNDKAQIYGIELLSVLGFAGGLAASLYNLFASWRTPAKWFAKFWSVLLVLSMFGFFGIGIITKLLTLNAQF